MKKILLFTLASSVFMHAVFAQGAFLSPWLIGLFGALVLIMFAIFWLMKNQSPDIPMHQIDKSSPASTANPDKETLEQLKEMPHPRVHNEFYEVSSEHKPLPDDKMVVAQMKNKMDMAKKHGLPKKEHLDKKIIEAVDEILQEEFESRKPEFRGEKKEPQLPAKYEAEKHLHWEPGPKRIKSKNKAKKTTTKTKSAKKKPAKKKKAVKKKSTKKPAKKKALKRKKSPKKKSSKNKSKSKKKKTPGKKKRVRKTTKRKKVVRKRKLAKKKPKSKKKKSSLKKKSAAKKKSPKRKKRRR